MKKPTQGRYAIEQKDNVLLIDAHGPFTEVTAEEYHMDIVQHTEQMVGEPWGSLITFHGNSIFPPHVEQQLKKTTQYRQQHGMIAIAVVILDSTYADLQQMQLQEIYQDCNIVFHVFSDNDNAMEWLHAYIGDSSLVNS